MDDEAYLLGEIITKVEADNASTFVKMDTTNRMDVVSSLIDNSTVPDYVNIMSEYIALMDASMFLHTMYTEKYRMIRLCLNIEEYVTPELIKSFTKYVKYAIDILDKLYNIIRPVETRVSELVYNDILGFEDSEVIYNIAVRYNGIRDEYIGAINLLLPEKDRIER